MGLLLSRGNQGEDNADILGATCANIMSFQIVTDRSKWDAFQSSLQERFRGMGFFMKDYMDRELIPALQDMASSTRQVKTGTYAYSWVSELVGEDEVNLLSNAYYWIFLEHGTSRGIKARPVVEPVIQAGTLDLINGAASYLVP